MAKERRNKDSRNSEKLERATSPEFGMLYKCEFDDFELENYLTDGEIKASEKTANPPSDTLGWRLYYCYFRQFQCIDR